MVKSSLRVALVTSSYHPHVGGVEAHVRHVARHLQERGHEVEVWAVDRGAGLSETTVEGCRVRYLPTPLPARDIASASRFALAAPGAISRWLGAARAFRPDLLHVHCFGPNGPYADAVGALTRTPLVVSSHGETFADEHSVFDRSALLRAALRRSSQRHPVTGCSALVVDDLVSRFGAPDARVVPNGVELGLATDGNVPHIDPPMVLGVGRLVPQKGFDALIRAAAQAASRPAVHLVGDGAERASLQRLATELGIADRVTFHGRLGEGEVRRWMAAADVIAVPSRSEAFGIVILEAWASGTPVLATRRSGLAPALTDGVDSLLVDPDDIPGLAASLDRVLGDESLATRMVDAGSEQVRTYSWSSVVDAYLMLYQDVLGG